MLVASVVVADVAHLVECDLAKVEVVGSRPIIRSIGKHLEHAVAYVESERGNTIGIYLQRGTVVAL